MPKNCLFEVAELKPASISLYVAYCFMRALHNIGLLTSSHSRKASHLFSMTSQYFYLNRFVFFSTPIVFPPFLFLVSCVRVCCCVLVPVFPFLSVLLIVSLLGFVQFTSPRPNPSSTPSVSTPAVKFSRPKLCYATLKDESNCPADILPTPPRPLTPTAYYTLPAGTGPGNSTIDGGIRACTIWS